MDDFERQYCTPMAVCFEKRLQISSISYMIQLFGPANHSLHVFLISLFSWRSKRWVCCFTAGQNPEQSSEIELIILEHLGEPCVNCLRLQTVLKDCNLKASAVKHELSVGNCSCIFTRCATARVSPRHWFAREISVPTHQ